MARSKQMPDPSPPAASPGSGRARRPTPRQAAAPLAEKDLHGPVATFLEGLGFEVHAEVRDCDLAAHRGEAVVVVELKRALNLELFLQAAQRQKMTDLVYMAVPRPTSHISARRWRALLHLARRLELGLLTVAFHRGAARVDVVLDPVPFDRKRSQAQGRRERLELAVEIAGRHGNFNQAGSVRTRLMTAYRENAIHIATCLRRLGPAAPRTLRALGTGDKTLAILSRNVYGWFERREKGIYALAEAGEEAFRLYPEMVAFYDAGSTPTSPVSRKPPR